MTSETNCNRPIDRETSDKCSTSSSDEESSLKEKDGGLEAAIPLHSAHLRIHLDNGETAEMVYNSVVIDKEPGRSSASRSFSVDGAYLIVDITSPDLKYVQKSVQNLYEMCRLSKSVVDGIGKYHLGDNRKT